MRYAVKWQTPPESRRHSSKLDGLRAELRRNPGRWAVYPGATNALGMLRKSPVWAGFEFVQRNKVPYVRYVGETEPKR